MAPVQVGTAEGCAATMATKGVMRDNLTKGSDAYTDADGGLALKNSRGHRPRTHFFGGTLEANNRVVHGHWSVQYLGIAAQRGQQQGEEVCRMQHSRRPCGESETRPASLQLQGAWQCRNGVWNISRTARQQLRRKEQAAEARLGPRPLQLHVAASR